MVVVIVADNAGIASRHVAGIVCRQLEKNPDSVFLLPTGSTPLKVYCLLAEMVEAGKASFSRARTFNLDEYLGIEKSHPESYHSFMWKNFFGKIDVKKGSVSIPAPKPLDAKQFCKRYEERISKAGLDLALLGIGKNGHIGFNEPGTGFSSKTHVASLLKSTINANSRFFKSEKDVPTQAITAGMKTITGAKKIILMAFGKGKARAVRDALEKKPGKQVPASVLQLHKNSIFVLDKEAASLLKKTKFKPPVIEGIKLYSRINLPQKKRIAFFSPHPDDAAISSGGLLSALAEKNTVFEIIMTTGHRAIDGGKELEQRIKTREKETRAEAKILGTRPVFLRCRFYDSGNVEEADLKKIRALIKKISPEIAFVPQRNDKHPTHLLARKTALASMPHNIELWSYETPWGLFSHRKFNAVFEFSKKGMGKKLKAVRKHKSQTERTRFDTAVENLGGFRRIVITEQLFSQHGKKPLETKPFLELYNISKW